VIDRILAYTSSYSRTFGINKAVDDLNHRNKKITDTIFLAGSARSGTTWLSELFSEIPEYKLVFEPFHPVWFPDIIDMGVKYKPVLSNSDSHLLNYLHSVGEDCIRSTSPVFQFNNILKRLFASKVVVKSIRSHYVFPFISQEINALGFYYIVRNPLAVISSQIRTGYTGYTEFDGSNFVPSKKILHSLTEQIGLDQFSGVLKKANSDIELLAYNWGLENWYVLNNLGSNIQIVKYESLVSDFYNEITNLLEPIEMTEWIEKVIQKRDRPSRSTNPRDINRVKKDGLKTNIDFTKKQRLSIINVIENFGVSLGSEPDGYSFDY